MREDSSKCTPVTDLEDHDQETLWIEIKTRKTKTYIGVFYSPQENCSAAEVRRQYSQLQSQIIKLKQYGNIILTGDFNAKLPIKNEKVTQNKSRNGTHLEKLIKKNNLHTASLNATQGNWTRVNRKNPTERSIIDYIITNKELKESITNLTIDEKGIHRLKGKDETDHNTISLETNIECKQQTEKITVWDLNNKKGWEKYDTIQNKAKNNPSPNNYDQLEKLSTNRYKNL